VHKPHHHDKVADHGGQGLLLSTYKRFALTSAKVTVLW